MGAFAAFPFAGTNEDFAVLPALPTMKFVNRHGVTLANRGQKLKRFEDKRIDAIEVL